MKTTVFGGTVVEVQHLDGQDLMDYQVSQLEARQDQDELDSNHNPFGFEIGDGNELDEDPLETDNIDGVCLDDCTYCRRNRQSRRR